MFGNCLFLSLSLSLSLRVCVSLVVSGSMFLAIGAVSPNATVAQIISPVITVLFLIFGGFYINSVCVLMIIG
jgi:hypothetical protein